MFIIVLALKWPVWAKRQRSNAYKAVIKLYLSVLIKDIINEAHIKEKSKAAGFLALYRNKLEKDRKSSKKDKDRKKDDKNTNKSKDKPIYGPCPYCSSTNSNYKYNSCFKKKGNKEKRKE
jgi:hypothetical protein